MPNPNEIMPLALSEKESLQSDLIKKIKICDSSSDFITFTEAKIKAVNETAVLSQIKISLEKIEAGLLFLSGFEPETQNTPDAIKERTKSVCLIKEGWVSLKNILEINLPTRIDRTLALIDKNHAN